jgi:DUF2997 family protein
MAKIKIVIPKTGNITISVDGVKGPSCKKLTERFEKALGDTVSDVDTPEMYEQPETQTETESETQY